MLLAMLAHGYLTAGQPREGLTTLAGACEEVRRTGERFYEAEIRRLQAELLLQQGRWAEAEAGFEQAIEVARQQSAKSLELRAMVSLSRLWQSRGRRSEARHLLAEIYDRFMEGFDTPDLKDAKVLLEELA
jgi:predicted ATPase